MIFLWGKNTKTLEIYEDIDSACEECGAKTLFYIVYQDYYHIFGLPVFPLLKYGGIYCDSCENSKVNIISTKLSEYEKKTRTPIYMYSFTIVLLVIIIEMFFKSIFK